LKTDENVYLHQAKNPSKQHLFVSILKATDEKSKSRIKKLIHNPVYPYGYMDNVFVSHVIGSGTPIRKMKCLLGTGVPNVATNTSQEQEDTKKIKCVKSS
jgi:hypothetical protein